MNPSDFTFHAMNSVLQKSEAETIAANIMVILARTGNVWRKLSWEEYSEERKKDGNFAAWKERSFFEESLPYTVSEEKARSFSPNWNKVA